MAAWEVEGWGGREQLWRRERGSEIRGEESVAARAGMAKDEASLQRMGAT
jgi:hypothetical protein